MPVIRSTVNLAAGGTAKVTVTIRLMTGSATTPGYTADGEIVGRSVIETSGGLPWVANLVGNDDITPDGSYYEITVAVPSTGETAVSTIVVPSTGGPFGIHELLVTPPIT